MRLAAALSRANLVTSSVTRLQLHPETSYPRITDLLSQYLTNRLAMADSELVWERPLLDPQSEDRPLREIDMAADESSRPISHTPSSIMVDSEGASVHASFEAERESTPADQIGVEDSATHRFNSGSLTAFLEDNNAVSSVEIGHDVDLCSPAMTAGIENVGHSPDAEHMGIVLEKEKEYRLDMNVDAASDLANMRNDATSPTPSLDISPT